MKIGDRVKARSEGHASHSLFLYDRDMKRGEEGVITDIDENYLEIISDNGTKFCRINDFVEVVKPKQINPNDYEIYG
jgi:hypothetical protein